MRRRLIKIDQAKCNGCGACAAACHEGAIGLVGGKARLLREDYCDGLGDCLPACPTGAISFEEREAPAYDAAAVEAAKEGEGRSRYQGGCPGSTPRALSPAGPAIGGPGCSRLSQWPVQLKLVPVQAPYLDGAQLLVAADCSAYAYGNFHEDFIKGKTVLIGCPKLDGVDYSHKLTQLLALNNVRGVTVVRLEVPCCGGLEYAVRQALQRSGKKLPWQVVTLAIDGRILQVEEGR